MRSIQGPDLACGNFIFRWQELSIGPGTVTSGYTYTVLSSMINTFPSYFKVAKVALHPYVSYLSAIIVS